MNICVCGWYFADNWYGSLLRLNERFPVHIVANRHDDLLKISDLPYSLRENIGLEFGAYNYYLNEIWAGGPVIFCHDDLRFTPIAKGNEIVSGEDMFPELETLECDHAYVFNSRQADIKNNGMHGRMIYLSDKLIQWIKENGGIWYDKENNGKTHGVDSEATYNNGIYRFADLMLKAEGAGFDVNNKVYFPALEFGYRGTFKGKMID